MSETMEHSAAPKYSAFNVIAGIILVSLVFVGPKTPWGWIGIVPIVTGALGSCPVYSLFGINTCGVKR